MESIILGTRGSELALTQTEMTRAALAALAYRAELTRARSRTRRRVHACIICIPRLWSSLSGA